LYLCGMVSHTMIILALLPIPTNPPDYTLIIKLFLYFMLEPCHTNLTFLITLYQHGTPYLLMLSTAIHPVLLSHVLLLLL